MTETVNSSDRCGVCHAKLARIKWNDKCDILVCNNSPCHKFRSPVETLVKGE